MATSVPSLDAAGIKYSTTPLPGMSEQYEVDGVKVWIATRAVNGYSRSDMTQAQKDYLIAVSNPHLAQQYKDAYLQVVTSGGTASRPAAASGGGSPDGRRSFGPPGPLGAPAGPGGATATADPAQRDARARMQEVLGQYGLDSLADWAWQQILQGRSDAEILQDIRNTPEFKTRFPAIEERTKRGLAPISPGEYVAYERQARQVMRAAGLPESFYDGHDDFQNFLSGDVSISELNDRIQLGRQAAFEAPAEVRAALLRDYGVSEGGLVAYFLDPDRAQPILEKQYRAAQIGGAGTRTGFGATRQESERLADLGVTADQAQQGFGVLGQSRELFTPIDRTEQAISREEQLGAAFEGNSAAKRRIERRRRQRQAVFEAGGSYAATQGGVAGLDSDS